MRRRITVAIVGVTTIVLVVLTLPLSIVARRSVLASEVVDLQATTIQALAEVTTPIDVDQLAGLEAEPDAPPPFTVYDADGRVVFGDHTAEMDPLVARTLATAATATATTPLVMVTTPITAAETERVVGVLGLARPLTAVERRSDVILAQILAASGAAIALAWLIARRVARDLSRPLNRLAEEAGGLGGGGLVEHHPTGIGEIDLVGDALARSSRQSRELLARERRFSADVAHQLRTPLTGLRLQLEAARDDPTAAADLSATGLAHVTRLERTVSHLLALARGARPTNASTTLAAVVADVSARWQERVVSTGRELAVTVAVDTRLRASAESLAQVLDVLVDNAIVHGRGRIRVVGRTVAGGAAIDVVDEGTDPDGSSNGQIFDRGVGDHHGIGLHLARAIAEAEGGRLLRVGVAPTTFTLFVLAATEPSDDTGRR